MIKCETGFGDGEKIISSEVKYILTVEELREFAKFINESCGVRCRQETLQQDVDLWLESKGLK